MYANGLNICSRTHTFPNNIETFGLVSGLWTSAFALGAFIGPSVAGVLYDNAGFRNASMLIFALHIVVGLVTVCFLCTSRTKSAYIEIKEEKSTDVQSIHQPSITESMKR